MDVDNDLIGDPCDTNKDRYGQIPGTDLIGHPCDTDKNRFGQNVGFIHILIHSVQSLFD